MSHRSSRNVRLRARCGSTLILALWSLFLLTTFAVQLGAMVRQKLTLAHRLEERDKRYRIAEAGVKHAISELRKNDALYSVDFIAERWCDQADLFKSKKLGQGQFTISFTFEDGEFSRTMYGMQDEESKININKVSQQVIERLLILTADLSNREAEELSYGIVDWRDNDSFFQHPQFGAEDSDYKGLREFYEAKDADFDVIDELMLVDNMTQEIFDRISPYVTVYGDGKVNINTAPRAVLLAMGIQNYVVKNILLFRNGGDMIVGTGDDDIFIQTSNIVPRLSQTFGLSPSEIASLSNLVAAGHFVTKSENFMIRSEGKLSHKEGTTTIIAVSDRTGQVKYWREKLEG